MLNGTKLTITIVLFESAISVLVVPNEWAQHPAEGIGVESIFRVYLFASALLNIV
jgi:hypothetical protein